MWHYAEYGSALWFIAGNLFALLVTAQNIDHIAETQEQQY
jgi:hypothetical protein